MGSVCLTQTSIQYSSIFTQHTRPQKETEAVCLFLHSAEEALNNHEEPMSLSICINQTKGRGFLRLKVSNIQVLLSSPLFCILILGLQGQKGTKGESGVPGKGPTLF